MTHAHTLTRQPTEAERQTVEILKHATTDLDEVMHRAARTMMGSSPDLIELAKTDRDRAYNIALDRAEGSLRPRPQYVETPEDAAIHREVLNVQHADPSLDYLAALDVVIDRQREARHARTGG
jgi:hypothetical protein